MQLIHFVFDVISNLRVAVEYAMSLLGKMVIDI